MKLADRMLVVDKRPRATRIAGGMAQEVLAPMQQAPYGYCQCGCGQRTSLAPQSDTKRGLVKGEPYRFLPSHHARLWRRTGPNYEVDSETGCWLWLWGKTPSGYGRVRSSEHGRHMGAHKLYYERANGPVPEGYELHHTCEVRHCVNPAHLEPVTRPAHRRLRRDTKLTAEIAVEIRAAPESPPVLADRYGVSVRTIYQVRAGEIWA